MELSRSCTCADTQVVAGVRQQLHCLLRTHSRISHSGNAAHQRRREHSTAIRSSNSARGARISRGQSELRLPERVGRDPTAELRGDDQLVSVAVQYLIIIHGNQQVVGALLQHEAGIKDPFELGQLCSRQRTGRASALCQNHSSISPSSTRSACATAPAEAAGAAAACRGARWVPPSDLQVFMSGFLALASLIFEL